MDTVKIGKFIKELREEKGLSQTELGDKIGVTYKTISRWENGSYMPPVEMFVELGKIFEISINELVNGERMINDEKYKEKAEEYIFSSIQAIFTFKERMDYFKKEWIKNHEKNMIIAGLLSLIAYFITDILLESELLSCGVIFCCIVYFVGLFEKFEAYMTSKMFDNQKILPMLTYNENEEKSEESKGE